MRLLTLAMLALLIAPVAAALSVPLHADAPLAAPPAAEATSVPVRLPEQLAAQAADMAPIGSNGFTLTFSCPAPPLGVDAAPCPNRIIDEDDILGNPGLAIDPLVPGRGAFASLHGSSARNGPTPLARAGQTHTTFTTFAFGEGISTDRIGGATSNSNWADQPYTPPQTAFPDSQEVLGLDVHATIDRQNTLHVASLYATPGEGNVKWNYTILLWKFDQNTRQKLQQEQYDLVSAAFTNRLPGSVIDTIWLQEIPQENLVALFWHERAPADHPLSLPGIGNVTSWIGGATTSADTSSPWVKLPDTMLAAPCDISSNPALIRERVFFACESSATGEIGLSALDFAGRVVDKLDKAPLVGGKPTLAATPEGDLALLTVRMRGAPLANATLPPLSGNVSAPNASAPPSPSPSNATPIEARLTISHEGEGWSRVKEWGDAVHNASRPVKDARVTAALFRGGTSTIHLIYEEEAASQRNETRLHRWSKQLVVLDLLARPLVDLNLNLSDKGEVFPGRTPSNTDPYGDTRDSLIDVNGQEYMAFADYGVVVFAMIDEHDARTAPVVLESAPPAVEPLPAAQSVVTVTGVGLGATAAVGAGALATRRLLQANAAGRGKK